MSPPPHQPDPAPVASPRSAAQMQHERRAEVVMTSPGGQASQPLASGSSPMPSTRAWEPKSKFVQNALGSRATPPRAAGPSAAAPTAGSVPSPWKESVYARELNAADADWEEEDSRNDAVSPKKAFAHELGNLNDNDDWDDGPVLPPAPVASTPLKKGSGKKTISHNDSRSSNTADRTPSGKTRTKSGRVPAT
ncbi:hypothetical protein FRB90_010086 [Tulasnella sp. 427]|nr:hypothetical protein FRB90_010086 [Tulasnella sp. 427]